MEHGPQGHCSDGQASRSAARPVKPPEMQGGEQLPYGVCGYPGGQERGQYDSRIRRDSQYPLVVDVDPNRRLLPLDTRLTVGVDRSFRWEPVCRLGLIASSAGHEGRSAPCAPSSTSRSKCVCRFDRLLMLCGMADTQPGRTFDMRRSAVESRLAASRLAAFPPTLTLLTLGQAAPFSHAPVCGHVAGWPLHVSQLPLNSDATHPEQAASFSHAPVCDEVRTVAPLVAAPPAVYSPTNHPGPICVFFTPAPSLASGIRPWAECVQRQPITNGPRHGCPARVST